MTTLVAPQPTGDVDDVRALAELHRLHAAQRIALVAVAVSVGGLALAKQFPTLHWDHLLYTGSPTIGREIARAAAENLVPVTLELGGKCPAILTADSVRNVIGSKLIKNGQMCISVDYALVPRGQVDEFVAHAERYLTEELPGYASSADCAKSGSGRQHGIEGFREFSNPRGVVVRGTDDLADAFLPPYGATAQAVVDAALSGTVQTEGAGPGSV